MAMLDRRVKRTQRLLAEALISLTLEKGYDAVSIRDITERADVAYATFFRHHEDKEALLDEWWMSSSMTCRGCYSRRQRKWNTSK